MRPRLAKLICRQPNFDMSSFNESNTVEQMILDAVERDLRFCARASSGALGVVNEYEEAQC